MADFELITRSTDPRVTLQGANTYTASPDPLLGGTYGLPEVTMQLLVPGRALPKIQAELSVDDPQAEPLAEWLRGNWLRLVDAGHPAAPVTVLTNPGIRVPGELITAAATVAVTWSSPAVNETVLLVTLEPSAATADPPVREYTGFAVFDFGTTTTAITLRYKPRVDLQDPLDPEQARALARALAGLLRVPLTDTQDEWAKLLGGVPAEVFRRTGDQRTLDEIAAQLDSGNLEVLHAVLGPLEVACHGRRAPRELHRRLDQALRAAYAVPPLEANGLQSVRFSAPEESSVTALSSMVHVVTFDPLAVRMELRDQPPKDGGKIEGSVRSLKREFPSITVPRPLSTLREFRARGDLPDAARTAQTDDLLGQVFKHLYGEAQQRIEENPDTGEPLALRRVFLLCPTVTPPAARERLRELALKAMPDVEIPPIDVDEGIAAALYFVMLGIGSASGIGVEALRGRSRRLPDGPNGEKRWQRTILVVDIGGGTTDIALIGVRLTEIPVGADDDRLIGRRYRLTPEVLGTTGHPQLGGDNLTLRVFYWLKAAIADAYLLAAGQPAENLARQVVTSGARKPVPATVRARLDELVPTRGEEKATEFLELWHKADDAKRKLGARRVWEDGDLSKFLSASVKTSADPGGNDLSGSGNSSAEMTFKVTLGSEDFERLVRPLIRRAAGLAAAQVSASFRGDPDARLDEVALSGRTVEMPLVAETIRARLADLSVRGRPLTWNPTNLVVEKKRAKEVASMGAAWAATVAGVGVDERAQKGDSRIAFQTGGLMLRLPCDFRLRGNDDVADDVLRAGDPFVIGHKGELGTARGPWGAVWGSADLYRMIDASEDIVWGQFVPAREAALEHVSTESDNRWKPLAPGQPKVQMQVEVDQRLNPFVNLCLGRVPYLVAEDEGYELRQQALIDGTATAAVFAVPDQSGPERAVEVFPALPNGTVAESYPDTFVRPAATDGQPQEFRARVSTVPLPEIPDGGTWTFLARTLDGDSPLFEPVPKPEWQTEEGASWFASLSEDGRLRLHLGRPRYWPARSFTDLLRNPGSVLRKEMRPGVPDLDPDWIPFTGEH
ncbi:hypothetical protein CcI49_19570 [Frankia sp. CcI49]|uniref:hypothetical protein n=1 Tax=Frankia sp. CcI49 TaxID=1745382 RepID=UPI0009788239|nr:hypothetical protein [Frankia sp. CcI49]ONH58919.1 hypothetical protein CcI49_19570 [Frankia sp. CcI49]